MKPAIQVKHAEPKPTDALTGLPARAAFDVAFQEMVKRAHKSNAGLSLAVIDIDLFGRINHARGREAGDAVLHQVGQALHAAAGEGAQVFRFGGDAFAVAWEGQEKEQAFLMVEALRQRIESGFAGEASPIGLSVGLAAYPDDGEKAAEVVQRANGALYRAKVSGRSKVCLAREEKMVTKTSHYTQGQLMGLRRLAEREGIKDAELLREALNDLLRKYNA